MTYEERDAPASTQTETDGKETALSSFLSISGYILAVSYPILALSTGVRAGYQLFLKAGVDNHLAPSLSGVAALAYLLATIGFAYRRRWAWWLSVTVLVCETALTLLVGTLSILIPDVIGRTVWRLYGVDYGFFPLFQPVIGLLWLFWPQTRASYGVLTREGRSEGRVESGHTGAGATGGDR